MHVKLWGTRGSIPAPGPATVRYGGNTSCVQVTLSDGTLLVLDAGSGIRNMTFPADGAPVRRIHVLLTHLHLDHIQGLLFFSPLFDSDMEITIWGPTGPGGTLRDRIARYLSAPLTPVEVRELPAQLDFRDTPSTEWDIGAGHVRAEAVIHRGPTLGYRIEDEGVSLAYIPDHEPALAGQLEELEAPWLSGLGLAAGADLLLHDCQYTDAEYPRHFGWGHSSVGDALTFARRASPRRTLLFHHDPRRSDDELDALLAHACERWQAAGRDPGELGMAAELGEIELGARASA